MLRWSGYLFSPSQVPGRVAKTPKGKNQSLVGCLFWKIWKKVGNFEKILEFQSHSGSLFSQKWVPCSVNFSNLSRAPPSVDKGSTPRDSQPSKNFSLRKYYTNGKGTYLRAVTPFLHGIRWRQHGFLVAEKHSKNKKNPFCLGKQLSIVFVTLFFTPYFHQAWKPPIFYPSA